MSSVRALLAFLLLSLGATAAAEAQQPQAAPQGARRAGPLAMVDRWLDGITLTAPQTAAVDSIKRHYEPQMLALRTEMREAMQSGTGDREAMMRKSRELEAKIATDVRARLGADQHAAFDRNREAAAARRRDMMQRGGRGPGQR